MRGWELKHHWQCQGQDPEWGRHPPWPITSDLCWGAMEESWHGDLCQKKLVCNDSWVPLRFTCQLCRVHRQGQGDTKKPEGVEAYKWLRMSHRWVLGACWGLPRIAASRKMPILEDYDCSDKKIAYFWKGRKDWREDRDRESNTESTN